MAVFTDDFNRSDGPIGSDYNAVANTLNVISNEVKGNASSTWNVVQCIGASFTDDHYTQIEIRTLSGTDQVRLDVRLNSSGAISYQMLYESSSPSLRLDYYDGASDNFLFTHPSPPTLGAGDILKLAVSGGNIDLYVNGVLIKRVYNASLTTNPPGFGIESTANRIDNYEAGDYTPISLPNLRDSASGANTAGGTSHSVDMPATVEAGDLLIAMIAFDGTPTVTWDNSTAGTWSDYIDADGPACHLTIKAKVADGTEDGKTLTIGTSASEQSVNRVVCYKDWEGTLGGGLNIPTGTTGTSTTPDPPVATDSWGSVKRATIAVCGVDRREVTAFPTNWTDNQFADNSLGPSGCSLGTAKTSGIEDVQNPGTFTIDASDGWVAATISIKGSGVDNTDRSPGADGLDITGIQPVQGHGIFVPTEVDV